MSKAWDYFIHMTLLYSTGGARFPKPPEKGQKKQQEKRRRYLTGKHWKKGFLPKNRFRTFNA
ncbi:unnamed protein product [Larinioides sclopetarius]|uniref:40S ribosomal protein S30 n=1 Tax=Larinioides sclopetarius TaxID=280406 RepID=A0AAV1ZA94_9ARAC